MNNKQRGSSGKPNALHPRNPHAGRYDFDLLCAAVPALKECLRTKPDGAITIDFADPFAVKCLNKAILAQHYQVTDWDIPDNYLCPPIPGRADYVHYLADLLATRHTPKVFDQADPYSLIIPHAQDAHLVRGAGVKVLDIGVGANGIYPIVGAGNFDWSFLASDIDPVSVASVKTLVQAHPSRLANVFVVLQSDRNKMFEGVVSPNDKIDISMCNPPFHNSLEEAEASHRRKRHNLNKHQGKRETLSGSKKSSGMFNFGGQGAELWCKGGERLFLRKMTSESLQFCDQVCWFSSLVSNSENVAPLKKRIKKLGARYIAVMDMGQGQKKSRIVAWSYQTKTALLNWGN